MNIIAQEIPHLLEKYWEGATTLEEEKVLQDYFNAGNVEAHLKQFQPFFQFFNNEKEVVLGETISNRIVASLEEKHRTGGGRMISLMPHLWKFAAAAVLLFGAFFLVPQWLDTRSHQAIVLKEDSYDDPEKAYAEVKAALMLVSNKMKKGTSVADKNLGKLKKATIFRTEETEL